MLPLLYKLQTSTTLSLTSLLYCSNSILVALINLLISYCNNVWFRHLAPSVSSNEMETFLKSNHPGG
ncbi:hypothetical protein ACS0TY_012021 [Phlomoides rotata]